MAKIASYPSWVTVTPVTVSRTRKPLSMPPTSWPSTRYAV